MNALLANILEAHGGRAYAPDRQPIRDLLMVSIDIRDVRFEQEGAGTTR